MARGSQAVHPTSRISDGTGDNRCNFMQIELVPNGDGHMAFRIGPQLLAFGAPCHEDQVADHDQESSGGARER